ncbi:MAG: ATP-binding protein [Rikenellaceae bacterium]
MISESQNIEWKESWRDEYLKWICGFANANGGKIVIGKSDNGDIVGVKDAKKLSEDIPNKVRDSLGVMVDVNLYEEDNKDYIEVIVPSYPNPINYKGQYHYRSGCTKQELKGEALNRFLSEKTGKSWDEVAVPNVVIDDLSQIAINRFKAKAIKSNRLDQDVLEDSTGHLLYDLHLIDDNTKLLKRAAILLFHPNPDRFYLGAYIKIGFFKDDNEDLLFQDEVRGSIMEQIDKTIDLLQTKYSINAVTYDGISREEVAPFPAEAIRETLLNAIAHKSYADPSPIQISVYPDHIVFWNAGNLPTDWTIDNLFAKHPSRPYNPFIANAMFRSGDIESWGRGYKRIMQAVKEYNILPPKIEILSGLMVSYYNSIRTQLKAEGLDERQIEIIELIVKKGSITNGELQVALGLSKAYITRLLQQLSMRIEKHGEKGRGVYYTLKEI